MDSEIKSFCQVWILAITCLSYCYYISSKIPSGISRLVSLLPVFYLFIILPLKLSTIHLCGFTSFLLVWLTNFKLLLFAFGQGPLFPTPKKLSHFISIACLPIKIKPNSINNPSKTANNTNPSQQKIQESAKSCPNPKSSPNLPLFARSILVATKVVLFVMLLQAYNYKQYLHQYVILLLHCLHIYLFLESSLAICASMARAVLGFELVPQFNEPYLSTSLQDFWGRRWNLMVTSILRSTVYLPIRRISACVVGHTWAQMPAIIATFFVSGLMHDIIYYYYLTRVPPTWELTSFFILHGVFLSIEVAAKRALTNRCRLQGAVSRLLLLMFLIITSLWLFCPQLVINGVDERLTLELMTFANFVKNKVLL